MKAELLTINSPKTIKGEPLGYLTGILYLDAGSRRICPWATPECIKGCLNISGHAAIPNDRAPGYRNPIDRARKMRTELFLRDRKEFTCQLMRDIDRLKRWAAERGLKPALRLNGTSDIMWEKIYGWLAYQDVILYDYTKAPPESRPNVKYIFRHDWRVYHITQSWHEKADQNYLDDTMRIGRNMAVVFATKRGQPLPATWRGIPVIDGDLHDLRFLDPPGVIVGLRAKGRMKKGDWKGFVQPV